MSREERKMAQIIASIERMEQRKAATPSSGSSSRAADSTGESDGNASSSNAKTNTSTQLNQEHHPKMERMNSNEIHAQVQKSTRLGAKGKKLKPLSTSHGGSGAKVRSGSKKAKTPQELVVSKKGFVDCKLTPKKRWIQLWNEQLSSDDSADGDTKELQEPEKEPVRETIVKDELPIPTNSVELKAAERPKPTRPTITQEEEDPAKEEGEADDDDEEGAVKVTQAEQTVTPSSPQADEQKEASISPVSSVKESSKDAAARSSKPVPSVDSRRVTKKAKSSKKAAASVSSDSGETEKAKGGKAATASANDLDASLRVKTPQVVESSHLSPPLDRNSPSTAASISPSAKTKDAEPNSAEASSPSKGSALSPPAAQHEAKASPNSPIPRKSMAEVISKARDNSHERSRKRSLERKESEPLTEEEKRRAERRRKRKSNWDVGDPRFASRDSERQSVRSPSSDDNSKFPPGRPSWRHSMSMDATYSSSSKSSFQNNSNSGSHRASFSGGSSGSGPARRGFYQSTSLPLDRSRSAGRSSGSRYNYGNGNGSYR